MPAMIHPPRIAPRRQPVGLVREHAPADDAVALEQQARDVLHRLGVELRAHADGIVLRRASTHQRPAPGILDAEQRRAAAVPTPRRRSLR